MHRALSIYKIPLWVPRNTELPNALPQTNSAPFSHKQKLSPRGQMSTIGLL